MIKLKLVFVKQSFAELSDQLNDPHARRSFPAGVTKGLASLAREYTIHHVENNVALEFRIEDPRDEEHAWFIIYNLPSPLETNRLGQISDKYPLAHKIIWDLSKMSAGSDLEGRIKTALAGILSPPVISSIWDEF